MSMIQKMKIIKSKFRIDSYYFGQYLVNTDIFKSPMKFDDFGKYVKNSFH